MLFNSGTYLFCIQQLNAENLGLIHIQMTEIPGAELNVWLGKQAQNAFANQNIQNILNVPDPSTAPVTNNSSEAACEKIEKLIDKFT